MLDKLRDWCRKKAPFLFEDTMPVWLTIVVGISAATGAYFLSPMINRQFEIDAARSSHITKTTEQLNTEIIILSQKVRRLNDALVNSSDQAVVLRQDALDSVTKLQWMLVDISVVLKSDSDIRSIQKLTGSIEQVRTALNRSVDVDSQSVLLPAMRELGLSTRDVLDRLYSKAYLK